ncbi:hypothetical protein PAPYR_12584 [Paratrimastix pyriformis]|uniref:Uncharacterized protein n=1 Tax=Paratrimastix pyriformis TaxID=342808 RepID=A0ABQ8U1L9_9EUKA|nr:hypothetical protein PAPYR_12584 [Paratrimastix pyriformis]
MDDALAQEDQQQTHGMEGAHLHDASGGEPWGLTWGGVMPNVSCLHPHRLMPSVPVCLNQRQHSAPFGGDLDTRGDIWSVYSVAVGKLFLWYGVHSFLVWTPPIMHLQSGVGVVFPLLAPPGAGRDPLEEMFGVRMVDPESFFVVFIETFGSCDSQLDCFTALRGTDSFPPYSASVAGGRRPNGLVLKGQVDCRH